jgi:hypothetical protein
MRRPENGANHARVAPLTPGIERTPFREALVNAEILRGGTLSLREVHWSEHQAPRIVTQWDTLEIP